MYEQSITPLYDSYDRPIGRFADLRLEILADRTIGRLEIRNIGQSDDWTIGYKKYWPIGRFADWRLEILANRPIRRLEILADRPIFLILRACSEAF
jgi:hypothetical protein